MNYDHIITDACKLQENSYFNSIVDDAVREHLMAINSDISDAHSINKTTIFYKLPVKFNIDNIHIDEKTIQTIVYYNIVTTLEKRNYDVGLVYREKYCDLVIDWSKTVGRGELDKMNKVLIKAKLPTKIERIRNDQK